MSMEEDPDLLLAFALSFPFMERKTDEKPAYEAAFSQLVSLLSAKSSAPPIDFVYTDYFVQFLGMLTGDPLLDPADIPKNLSIFESILQNSCQTAFPAATTCFLIKVLSAFSVSLSKESLFNSIFESMKKPSSFYRFSTVFLNFCICALESASVAPSNWNSSCAPSMEGLEASVVCEMRKYLSETISFLCSTDFAGSPNATSLQELSKSIPEFPDQLLQQTAVPTSGPLSLLERYQETQHDSLRTADSFFDSTRKTWVNHNEKILCQELNGLQRVMESFVRCLAQKHANPVTFHAPQFLMDCNSFVSLLSLFISADKENRNRYCAQRANAAAALQLSSCFIDSLLILLSIQGKDDVNTLKTSELVELNKKFDIILKILELTGGEHVKRNSQAVVIQKISQFFASFPVLNDADIFSHGFFVPNEVMTLLQSHLFHRMINISSNLLFTSPSLTISSVPCENPLENFDCLQVYSQEQILEYLKQQKVLHWIISSLVLAYKESSLRCHKKKGTDESEKDEEYEYSDDDDDDISMEDFEEFVDAETNEEIELLVTTSKLLRDIFVSTNKDLLTFIKPSALNDQQVRGLLFIGKCQSPEVRWCLPDTGDSNSSKNGPLIVSSEFDFNMRQIWAGFIEKCFSSEQRDFLLHNVGYSGKSLGKDCWPLFIPSEQLVIICKLIFADLQRVSSSPDEVIMPVWNGVLNSLSFTLQDPSNDISEVLVPEYTNLLLNLFHFLNEQNKQQIVSGCMKLLLIQTKNRSSHYFMVMSRLILFIQYFLHHFDDPADDIESHLENNLFTSDTNGSRNYFAFGVQPKEVPVLKTRECSVPVHFYHSYKTSTTKFEVKIHPKAAEIILQSQSNELQEQRYSELLLLLDLRLNCSQSNITPSDTLAMIVYENFFQIVWEFITHIPIQSHTWTAIEKGSNDEFSLPNEHKVLLYLFWFTQRVFEDGKAPGVFVLRRSVDYYLQQFLGLVGKVHKQIATPSELVLFKSLSVVGSVYTILQYLLFCTDSKVSFVTENKLWGTIIAPSLLFPGDSVLCVHQFFADNHSKILSSILSSLEIFHGIFLQALNEKIREVSGLNDNLSLLVVEAVSAKISLPADSNAPSCIKDPLSKISAWLWNVSEAPQFTANLSASQNVERVIWTYFATPNSSHLSALDFVKSIVLFLQSTSKLCFSFLDSHSHLVSHSDRERIIKFFTSLQLDIPPLSNISLDILKRMEDSKQNVSQLTKLHKMKKLDAFLQFFMGHEFDDTDGEQQDKYSKFQEVLVSIIQEISNFADSGSQGDAMNAVPCMTIVRLLVLNTCTRVNALILQTLNKMLQFDEKSVFTGDIDCITSLPSGAIQSWVTRNFLEVPVAPPAEELTNPSFDALITFAREPTPACDLFNREIQKKITTRLIFALSQDKTTARLIFQTLIDSFASAISQPPDSFLSFFVVLKQLANQNQWVPVFLSKSIQALTNLNAKTELEYANVSIVVGSLQRIFQLLDTKKNLLDTKQCTSISDQGKFREQHWFYCYSCDLIFSKGICSVCVDTCHKDHEITYAHYSSFSCDCNTVGGSHSCKSTQSDSSASRFEESLRLSGSNFDVFKKSILQAFREDNIEPRLIEYAKKLYHDLTQTLSSPMSSSCSEKLDVSNTTEIHCSFVVKLKGDSQETREIKQFRSSFVVARSILDISSRGYLAVAERSSVSIGAVPHLFQSPKHEDEKIFVSVEVCNFSFPLVYVLFHPTNPDCLVVAGLHECVVLSLDSSGSVTNRLTVHFANTGSDDSVPPIIKVMWMPDSLTELIIVTTKFVKIFDLAKNNKEPIHYFSGLHDQFQDICLLSGDEPNILILTKAGRIFIQSIPGEKQPEKLYVCNGISLPDSISNSLNDALSIQYCEHQNTIIVTFKDSQSFVATLNENRDAFVDSFKFTSSGMCWKEIPGYTGSFFYQESIHSLYISKITQNRVQSKLLPYNVESFCLAPFVSDKRSPETVVAVVLLKDGTLQGLSVAPAAEISSSPDKPDGPILSDSVQEMEIRRKILALHAADTQTLVGGSNEQMNTKRNSSCDFERMKCVTNDVTFGGDVLLYYNEEEAKQRSSSNSLYLVSPNNKKFKISLRYDQPGMMIAGVRVLVGHSSLKYTPTKIKVEGTTKQCKMNVRRWYEFVFDAEHQLLYPNEVTINAKHSKGPQLVIDSIQVYAVSRESVIRSKPNNFVLPRCEPQTLLEKASILTTLALARFYSILSQDSFTTDAENFKQAILPLLQDDSLLVLHSALKKVLLSLTNSQESYHNIIDDKQLAHVTAKLAEQEKLVSPSVFIGYCAILQNVMKKRPHNIQKHLVVLVPQLHASFWLLYRSKVSVFGFMLSELVGILIGLLYELSRIPESSTSCIELLRPFLVSTDDSLRITACRQLISLLRNSVPQEDEMEVEVEEISFSCDSCNKSISTDRFHCNQCSDFDLCTKCSTKAFPTRRARTKGANGHLKSHTLTKIQMNSQLSDPMDEDENELQAAMALSLNQNISLPTLLSVSDLFTLWNDISNYRVVVSYLKLLHQLFVNSPAKLGEYLLTFLTICRPFSLSDDSKTSCTVLVLGFIHNILTLIPDSQREIVYNEFIDSGFVPELQKLLEQTQQKENTSIDKLKSLSSDDNSEESLLAPQKEEFSKNYFVPLLSTEQITMHCSKSKLIHTECLLTENIIQLIHSIHSKAPASTIPSLFIITNWKTLLCHILEQNVSQLLHTRVKQLLTSFCGSKQEYREYKDLHLYEILNRKIFELATNSKNFRVELPYVTAVELMNHLTTLWKNVSKRPAHWQTFLCVNPKILSLLWCSLPSLREEPALLAIKLISATFKPSDDSVTSPVKVSQSLIELITSPFELFSSFIPKSLLENHTEAMRVECSNLVLWIWLCGNTTLHKQLGTLFIDLILRLPKFGRNSKQFFDLLSKIIVHPSTQDSQVNAFLPSVLETLRIQNQKLQEHPNSYLYRDLQTFVDFEGFYFEKDPCLVCNDTEVPYDNLKLDSMKAEMKYTDNSMIIKFANSFTLQRIVCSLVNQSKSRSIKTIKFYYNNKPIQSSTELTELRKNKSLWKPAKTSNLEAFQSELIVDFLVPITAANFMIEFAEFIDDESAQEKLLCPRCNHVVRDKHGICELCRENAMQCRQCRNINYENLRGFLCNECGYCKHTRLSFVFSAKPSFASEKIESDEDQDKALLLIDKESANAHQRYQQLRMYQTTMIHILSNHLIPSIRSQTSRYTQPDKSGLRSPVPRSSFSNFLARRAQLHAETISNGDQPSSNASSSSVQVNLANLSMGARTASLASLYNKESKNAFDSLCKSILILFATRRELSRYHSKDSHEFQPQNIPESSQCCFGCTNAFVSQCLSFLGSLLEKESVRVSLVNHGVIPDVLNARPIQVSSGASNTSQLLLCRLVRNHPQATDTLNGLLSNILHEAFEKRDSLTFSEFPFYAMQLLCQSSRLLDSCWHKRLKVLLGFVLQCVEQARDHPIICEHVLLPGLRVLNSLCDPSRTQSSTTSNAPCPPSIEPSITITEFTNVSNSYSVWKEKNEILISSDSKITCYKSIRTLLVHWKRLANISNETNHCTMLQNENWIIQLVLSQSSQAIRKEASQLLISLGTQPKRSLSLLNNCREQLHEILWLSETSNEFFTFFTFLLDQPGHRCYLVLHGFLEQLTTVISEQVTRIQSLEHQQSLDIAQGFVLSKLVNILDSFLQIPGISRKFKELNLVSPLLDNYLSLRSIIRQRTKLIDDTCRKLIDLLDSLHGENQRDRERFIVACIDALKKYNTESRTPLFIIEQLCHIISPEEEEPERLLVLFKSPTQEEYIRGSMNKNPYSTKECGPLMRDVKNKICRDLELLGLLEDDNGMELLVCNKIIKLDLNICDVYEFVWMKEKELPKDSNHPMVIVFRLQGLDGEATEELIENFSSGLNEENESATDPEEKFKITEVLGDCGGLDVLLNLLHQLDLHKDHELANEILKVLTTCCMIKTNRIHMLTNHSVRGLLETLKLSFPSEELIDISQNLLMLLECIISEASNEETSNSIEQNLSTNSDALQEATRQMKMFLQKLNAPIVRNNPRIVQCITHILPVLTYGFEQVALILVDFFTKIPWNSLNRLCDDSSECYLFHCFVNVTESIKQDANGMKLREIFLRSLITTNLLDYLHTTLPINDPSSSDSWKQAIECSALQFVLISLTGLVKGFEAAQKLIFTYPTILPSLEQLSSISTKEKLGNYAENLIDSFCMGNENVKQEIEKIRESAKILKEKISQKHREKVLLEMGMIQKPGVSIGKVVASTDAFDWNAALAMEEDEEFVCKVCKEGFSYLPEKLLGFYVYSIRVVLGDCNSGRGKDVYGVSTVSNFNMIHQSCHNDAARADAQRRPQPKGEWEGAMLRNSSTLCNNILPVLGPQTKLDQYGAMVEKYWADLPLSGLGVSSSMNRIRLLCHDLGLLIMKFATESSFSEESRGGGRESNIRVIPFFIQMGMFLLDHNDAPQRIVFENKFTAFLEENGKDSVRVDDSGIDDSVFFVVLSLFLMNINEWNAWKFELFKRITHVGLKSKKPQNSDVASSDAMEIDGESSMNALWETCRPYMIFFAIVDFIHNELKEKSESKSDTAEKKVKISHLSSADWIVQVNNKIRDSGFAVSEKFREFVAAELEQNLLPISSFDEMVDVLDLLPVVLSESTSVPNFIHTLNK